MQQRGGSAALAGNAAAGRRRQWQQPGGRGGSSTATAAAWPWHGAGLAAAWQAKRRQRSGGGSLAVAVAVVAAQRQWTAGQTLKNSPTELLGKLLFMAPMAICHHLKMLLSIPPVNDSPLVLKNMPVLFTSTKNYSASKSLFREAIYEIAEDDADELFHSKNSCTNHDCRIGEYCFCEATKVDLAESEDKRHKNHSWKKKNQLSSTLSSTVCLLCALFEDLGCAIELHEKIANEDNELHSLDPRNYLFNGQKEADYLFGARNHQ